MTELRVGQVRNDVALWESRWPLGSVAAASRITVPGCSGRRFCCDEAEQRGYPLAGAEIGSGKTCREGGMEIERTNKTRDKAPNSACVPGAPRPRAGAALPRRTDGTRGRPNIRPQAPTPAGDCSGQSRHRMPGSGGLSFLSVSTSASAQGRSWAAWADGSPFGRTLSGKRPWPGRQQLEFNRTEAGWTNRLVMAIMTR